MKWLYISYYTPFNDFWWFFSTYFTDFFFMKNFDILYWLFHQFFQCTNNELIFMKLLYIILYMFSLVLINFLCSTTLTFLIKMFNILNNYFFQSITHITFYHAFILFFLYTLLWLFSKHFLTYYTMILVWYSILSPFFFCILMTWHKDFLGILMT